MLLYLVGGRPARSGKTWQVGNSVLSQGIAELGWLDVIRGGAGVGGLCGLGVELGADLGQLLRVRHELGGGDGHDFGGI